MRFLSIYTPDERTAGAPSGQQHGDEIGKLVEESMRNGSLVATGGLLPMSNGDARIRSREGKITVTDGPFAESKEVIAGFAILEAKSREEAIEMCRRFLEVAGDGESEVFQIV